MISLKEFIDLEEVKSTDDVYQDHMKVMRTLAGGQSSADLQKLERTVKASRDRFLIKKFNENFQIDEIVHQRRVIFVRQVYDGVYHRILIFLVNSGN